MISISGNKTYFGLIFLSFVSTTLSYYLLRQFIVKEAGAWTAPMFIPIYYYVILVFVINTTLSLVAYKKDRFLSFAFGFTTISIDILILVALMLNIRNPNG